MIADFTDGGHDVHTTHYAHYGSLLVLVQVQGFKRNGCPAGSPFPEILGPSLVRVYKVTDEQLGELALGRAATTARASSTEAT